MLLGLLCGVTKRVDERIDEGVFRWFGHERGGKTGDQRDVERREKGRTGSRESYRRTKCS